MRNPKRRRDVSALFAVAGIAVFATTLALHSGESTTKGAWFGLVMLGFFVFALAAAGFFVFHTTCRRREKLLSGYKQLAKWTVSPIEAQQFRVNDKRHSDVGRNNTLKIRKQSDIVGFEAIVSQEALMIDDDFYTLADRRGLQWLPDVPPSLEFNMVTATKNGSLRWNIRFPIPIGAEAGGRAVWDYFNRPVIAPNLTRRYLAMRKFGVICFLASQLMLLFALKYFNDASMKSVGLMALIFGAIGSFVGMFAFVIAYLSLKKSKTGAS